jgi:alkanesulfonate monooxygenase SsuD/methylene tetrahydromethanopterin reductase-like flavin-dependent oxidoreductase (luciferase family)
VKWAKEHIAAGQAQAGRNSNNHRLTVYVWTSIGDDKKSARAVLRPTIANSLHFWLKQLEPVGIQDEITQLLKDHGEAGLAERMPDSWLDKLTVSGTPLDCADSVQRFVEAGADSVVLVPPFEDEIGQINRLKEDLLPLLRFNHETP